MKLRGWLLLLLFVHVMLHPWVHAVGATQPSHRSAYAVDSSRSTDGSASAIDQCELCRIGHNAKITSALPRTQLLNPGWLHVALQAVNYASLHVDLRRPSRAPPAA